MYLGFKKIIKMGCQAPPPVLFLLLPSVGLLAGWCCGIFPDLLRAWGYWSCVACLICLSLALHHLLVSQRALQGAFPSVRTLLLLLAGTLLVLWAHNWRADPGPARLQILGQAQGLYLGREVLVPTRAHDIDGVYTLLDGVSDTGGLGQGVMLSLVHDLIRYRSSNVTVLAGLACLTSLLLGMILGGRIAGALGARLGGLLVLAICLACAMNARAWDPFVDLALLLLLLLLGDLVLERRDAPACAALGVAALYSQACGLGLLIGLVFPLLLVFCLLKGGASYSPALRASMMAVLSLAFSWGAWEEFRAQPAATSVRSSLLAELGARRFLIVDQQSLFWCVNGVSTTTPERARRHPEAFAFHLRNHGVEDLLVIQELERVTDQAGARVVDEDELGAAFVLVPLSSDGDSGEVRHRVSRVEGLVQGQELLRLNAELGNSTLAVSSDDSRRIREAYSLQFREQLP